MKNENLVEDMGRIAEDIIGMAGVLELQKKEKEGEALREIARQLFDVMDGIAKKQRKQKK